MKHAASLALTFTAGVGAGLFAIAPLQAQNPPKSAFVIAETHVTNPYGFSDYVRQEPASLTTYRGRIVARALPDSREGAATDGTVTIYAFDRLQDADRWYNSPEYSKLKLLRQQSAETRLYVVSGVVQAP